jgi:ABC-type cobalamin/Fe3+-siderophores transport system ATPase subunit
MGSLPGLLVEELSWGHPLPGSGWRQLFSGFSMSCSPGQFVVVIGSNGSGKSTLLNLVAGTLRLGAGRIHLGGPPSAPLEGPPASPLDRAGDAKPPGGHLPGAHRG